MGKFTISKQVRVSDKDSPLFGNEYTVKEMDTDKKTYVLDTKDGDFEIEIVRCDDVLTNRFEVLIDLDGTLAKYDGYVEGVIGDPFPSAISMVKRFLSENRKVAIFTARAGNVVDVSAIEEWSKKHIGLVLPITNVKGQFALIMIDDRAIRVKDGEICPMCIIERKDYFGG